MPKKARPEWIEDALRELVSKIWPMEDPNIAENKMWLDSKIKELSPFILKHCPDDKAGKLVEAVKQVTFVAQVGRTPTIKDVEAWQIAMVKLEAALAEYEEVTK